MSLIISFKRCVLCGEKFLFSMEKPRPSKRSKVAVFRIRRRRVCGHCITGLREKHAMSVALAKRIVWGRRIKRRSN